MTLKQKRREDETGMRVEPCLRRSELHSSIVPSNYEAREAVVNGFFPRQFKGESRRKWPCLCEMNTAVIMRL